MRSRITVLGLGVLASLQISAQRAVCPFDTITRSLEKATAIDTISFTPQNTSAAYQYYSAPQDIAIHGARFYGYKTDTAGGNSMTVTVELRRATTDSVPGSVLLASANHTLTIPDSLDGPMSAYAIVVNWTPVTVNVPYTIVVKTVSTNPPFSLLHNRADGSNPDGQSEWLSGVQQGVSWIRSYSYFPNGNAFNGDFFIEPIVKYNLNASFITDPECLFDELGEYVQFTNEGSKIADDPMYNRYAHYSLGDRQRWNFGDGSGLIEEANPQHFYVTNGPYVASLTSKILNWTYSVCQSSVTQIIKQKPEQDFSYTTDNLDVEFKNETFGLFSDIYYTFGDSDSNWSHDENPVHKYVQPGTYWVCQSMMTSCGQIKKCKNVAVATNTALNCGKDSVRYTASYGTSFKYIKLKNTAPKRLYGVGQIFDCPQPMIVHGFSFYANHEGLFRDSYPVTCKIFKKGSNKLPDGDSLAVSIVHINKVTVTNMYSDSTRYTAIFDIPVNLTHDYILTIEYDSTMPIHIGTTDWIEHDGDGKLMAIGKINDTTWVTAASVAVFNCDGAACDCDMLIEPLVEYNLDANFTWDFDCLDPNGSPTSFTDASSKIIRNKMYNTIPRYTSSVNAYEWNFDDGSLIENIINPIHAFQGPGYFDVSLTVIIDGWTQDCYDTQVHTIVSRPTAGFGYEQVTSAVQFSDSSTNAIAYLWTFTDNTTSTLQNPIHYFTAVGKYEVCQYVSNECGSDTLCDSITINVVGIPDNFMSKLKVYPNPASDFLNVQVDLGEMHNLEIGLEDISGRTVRSYNVERDGYSKFYVGDLDRGTYILRLKAGEYEGTRKIVLAE